MISSVEKLLPLHGRKLFSAWKSRLFPVFCRLAAVVIFVYIVVSIVSAITTACQRDFDEMRKAVEDLKRHRNQISAHLNDMQGQLRTLACQADKPAGGWCDTEIALNAHQTDRSLAAAMSRFLAGKTVVGLCDGPGEYRTLFMAHGDVRKYDAYDGAANITGATGGQVKFLDLTLQQYWLPTYDWVVCLEPIDRVPPEFEHVVLDNIDRAAGEGAIISWTVPDDDDVGRRQVNPRELPLEHVEKVFASRGFRNDRNATDTLRANAELARFKANTIVFRRQ